MKKPFFRNTTNLPKAHENSLVPVKEAITTLTYYLTQKRASLTRNAGMFNQLYIKQMNERPNLQPA